MRVSKYKVGCYVNCRILLHPEIWRVKRFGEDDYLHYFSRPDDFVPIPIQTPVLLQEIGFKLIGDNRWAYFPLVLNLNTFELTEEGNRKIKTKINVHWLHELQIILSAFYEASLIHTIEIKDEIWKELGYTVIPS